LSRPDTAPQTDPPKGKIALSGAACAAVGIAPPCFVRAGGVTRAETPHGPAWIKTVEPPRRNINGMILPVIALLTPTPILRQSTTGKGGDTLLQQAERIRALREQGLPVADILYSDRDFLITADCGQTIEKPVRYAERREQPGLDEAALGSILLEMTRTLAAMHRQGTAHGRPKMRDFTWRDGTVTILDLEERPWEVMSMAEAQARDVFLWVHDLCSAPLSRSIAPQAAAILSDTMTPETRESLRRFLRLLRRVSGPARLMLRILSGNRELTSGIAAHDVLSEIVG